MYKWLENKTLYKLIQKLLMIYMKKIIFFPIILFLVLLISGCVQQVICDPPYILVGTECCLDVNENKICDVDETTTTTVATTVVTTTETTIPTTSPTTMITTTLIPQRVGVLDVRNNFFIVCLRSSDKKEWCSIETYGSTNEITINTSSLGAQENNVAEIATWIYNKGSSDIVNINYDISCDQTYPTNESKVITGDNDEYNSIISTIYFRCLGCIRGCTCTPGRYGQVINRMRSGDETTFRIELFGVKDFPYKADLDCDLKIYSDDPKVEHNFDLIIHFNV